MTETAQFTIDLREAVRKRQARARNSAGTAWVDIDLPVAEAVAFLTAEVADAQARLSAASASIDRLVATLPDSGTAIAQRSITARVTETEGTVESQASDITTLQSDLDVVEADLGDVEADVATRATATALAALTTRVTSAEGTITSQASSITALQSDLGDVEADVATRATATALTALTTRVTSAEGTITSQASSITTLTASLADKADATVVEELEVRVGDNEDDFDSVARWSVKTSVNGLVGGIGLYNDGTTTDFYVRADRFTVLPNDLDLDDARVPFAVVGGVVYLDIAAIRDGTILTAKIGNAVITNAKIQNLAVSAAKIQDLNVFDIAIGNSISSDNYVSGVRGFRIARTGASQFPAADILGTITANLANVTGTLSAGHIDSDVINAVTLWSGTRTISGETERSFAVGSVTGYQNIALLGLIQNTYGGIVIWPRSSIPSSGHRTSYAPINSDRTQSVLARLSGSTLYVRNGRSVENFTARQIIGFSI